MTSPPLSPTSAASASAAQTATRQPDAARHAAFDAVWADPRGFVGHLKTINNIPIAHRYMITAGVFFLVGGVQALLMRIQLGTPDNTFLDADTYNQLFTMHGTTMMFLVVIPFIEAIASYMLPLMLGTRDLPFPRLTALSYWTYLFGGIFLYSSFLFGLAPDGGWFAYLPLNSAEYAPGLNMDYWDIGLSVAEVAALGAGAELIVGTLRMRAPGMTFTRLPIFAWTMLIVAVMLILAFTPLIVATLMLELDRKELTHFFNIAQGGDPVLWQHLFWVFGHPEVYIMFLPAAAIVTHIVQTFSRTSLANHRAVVIAIVGTAVASFALWLHHMFVAGMSVGAMRATTFASFLIAIPAGVLVVSWLSTVWAGRVVWTSAMHFVAGVVVLFVLGGLTGVMVASVPFDAQMHDTYFVVAHFHYVLIGGVIFPFFAGVYYWLPKITGRLLDERWGRWSFWIMFICFNITFFPMHITGLLGMPRRIYTYGESAGWSELNLVSTLGALGLAAGILLTVVNIWRSRKHGSPAGDNPWGGDTLEWSETSPPRAAQFPIIPTVHGRHPLWEQNSEEAAIRGAEQELDYAPVRWRGALCVSIRDARPVAVVHLPNVSIWPFVMSVAFVFLFSGALIDNGWLAAIGGAGTAVALAGWFWPSPSERLAIEDQVGRKSAASLPLGVGGPLSNGWWGTWVLLLALATALLTIVASAFYLAPRWEAIDGVDGTAQLLAALALSLAALAGAATWWGGRGGTESEAGRRRFGLTSGLALDVALVLTLYLLYAYDEAAHPANIDARGSLYFLALLFQGIVTALHAIWTAVAALWAWRSPTDVRGLAPAGNVSVVSYFLVASWIAIAAIFYLTPSLG
ncbi:MAG: cytochrome c oxidase subunit I [Gemmatimonadaceae bacterium]